MPKHKQLVMAMWFKATKCWHRKIRENRCMVRDKVKEAKWKGPGVTDHWQQMKGLMMETAQDICGMTKGPCRHKETWWWNEEVAEADREKKIKYGKCISISIHTQHVPQVTQEAQLSPRDRAMRRVS